LTKKIRDRIEDPDDHANNYNLIIEGLWECERVVEEKADTRIADLESQLAAERAKMAELREFLDETLLFALKTEWGDGYRHDVRCILDRLDHASVDVTHLPNDGFRSIWWSAGENLEKEIDIEQGDEVYIVRIKRK
jgi:hypothetical protein